MPAIRPPAHRVTVATAIALLLASGCAKEQAAPTAPPPPPDVTVALPAQETVTDSIDFTGNTAAPATVELRARVKGFLKKVNFKDGAFVKAGEVLFEIDPTDYQIEHDLRKADLDGKVAILASAESNLKISKDMQAKGATSERELIEKTLQRDQAKTARDTAQALLTAATQNLTYTKVAAPFDGRMGRRLADTGNLVGATDATVLATIVQDDPIYCYIYVSERELLDYRAAHADRGRGGEAAQKPLPAFLGLANEKGYPHEGVVDFADNRVDATTGTIEVRATMPNPDRAILPGYFARIRLPLRTAQALLVPETALGSDQGGRFLLVADEKNIVVKKPVKLGALQEDGRRVILEGIDAKDRIIVNGMQRARPGKPVTPAEAGAAAPAAPAAPTAAPAAPHGK